MEFELEIFLFFDDYNQSYKSLKWSLNLFFMLVDWLSFIALIGYVFLTYLIARDIYSPLVSFYLKQIEGSHINFNMANKSKVEVEVFGVIWVKINGELFKHKDGFYGNEKSWVVQPFTEVFGHFYITDLEDKEGNRIEEFLKKRNENSTSFNIEIKYRRTLKNSFFRKLLKSKWKKTSPQKYLYNFMNRDFWLDV